MDLAEPISQQPILQLDSNGPSPTHSTTSPQRIDPLTPSVVPQSAHPILTRGKARISKLRTFHGFTTLLSINLHTTLFAKKNQKVSNLLQNNQFGSKLCIMKYGPSNTMILGISFHDLMLSTLSAPSGSCTTNIGRNVISIVTKPA